MWEVVFSKNADKDKHRLKQAGLDKKTKALLSILQENPFQNPPPYEKLIGDLKWYCSRRINIQHRPVYKVDQEHHRVEVRSMWTNY